MFLLRSDHSGSGMVVEFLTFRCLIIGDFLSLSDFRIVQRRKRRRLWPELGHRLAINNFNNKEGSLLKYGNAFIDLLLKYLITNDFKNVFSK